MLCAACGRFESDMALLPHQVSTGADGKYEFSPRGGLDGITGRDARLGVGSGAVDQHLARDSVDRAARWKFSGPAPEQVNREGLVSEAREAEQTADQSPDHQSPARIVARIHGHRCGTRSRKVFKC